MRLFLLTALTITAFAANSVLNRMALVGGSVDALVFAAIRLGAGAIVLGALCLASGRRTALWGRARGLSVAALLAYMIGFSLAYRGIDAGTGALILFGGVQVTMVAGAALTGEPVPPRRWAGGALAFVGLAWLVRPGTTAPDALSAGLMALAAFGWGIYSLAGRRAGDPLAATAANFWLSFPLAVATALIIAGGTAFGTATPRGAALAVVSGALTSGLGYALWYAILPRLGAARAGVAQMAAPVLAIFGGAALLGEAPTWRMAGGAALVLGGVALALVPWRLSGRPRRGQAGALPAGNNPSISPTYSQGRGGRQPPPQPEDPRPKDP